MQHVDTLRPDTRQLLDQLSGEPEIQGFILIGGTALAMRHGHRESEDIDLAWAGTHLPQASIASLINRISAAQSAVLITDPIEQELAEDAGLNLADHQQDWLIGKVKVTFFTPIGAAVKILKDVQPDHYKRLAIADDDTLFRLKSAVLLQRTAPRDVFDLVWFCKNQDKTVADILAEMRKHDPHMLEDMHLSKIAPVRFPETQPGFKALDATMPQNPSDLLVEARQYVTWYREARAEALARNLRER